MIFSILLAAVGLTLTSLAAYALFTPPAKQAIRVLRDTTTPVHIAVGVLGLVLVGLGVAGA